MGDRCYLRVTFRASDESKIDEVVGAGETPFDEIDDDPEARPSVYVGVVAEANYGWSSELEELAKAGLPFLAFNDAGGNYGSGLTASTGDGKLIEADADSDGFLTARIDSETGNPTPDSLAVARAFIAAEKHINALFDAGSPAEAPG